MKVIRTPDEHYFNAGYVKFSKSKQNGELYYEITLYNGKTQLYCAEKGKVKDEAHLKELQCMEKEIENWSQKKFEVMKSG